LGKNITIDTLRRRWPMINEIDFSAKNLTSNAGLFLIT